MEDDLQTLILQLAKEFGQDLDDDFVSALIEQLLYEFIPENLEQLTEDNE